MTKRIALAVLFFVILVAGWVVYLYWVAGQFKTIEPHFSGTCKAVAGVVGPEDITIHPRTGVAYVSACDRQAIQGGYGRRCDLRLRPERGHRGTGQRDTGRGQGLPDPWDQPPLWPWREGIAS
jgi:hypothetical protein